MLKVLLIDDEPIVREGLKTIIDWEQHGFQVCGEGIDGDDGLNKILEQNPDLVLMDIKMPGLYGIDLIRAARQQGYNGKIIILSGYSEFEYAQNAIKLGVKSYLLKPVDEEELVEIVNKVREEIESEGQVQKYINDSRKLLKNKILKRLISDSEKPGSLKGDIETCNININFDFFQVVLLEITSEHKGNTINKEFEDYVREYLASILNIEVFSVNDRLGLIFKGKPVKDSLNVLKNLYRELTESGNENTFIAVGRLVKSLEELPQSYKDAKDMLGRRFIFEDLKIAVWEDINNGKGIVIEGVDTIDAGSLYTYIEVGDIEKVNAIFSEIETRFKQSNMPTEKIKGLCVNAFIELKDRIAANYSEHRDKMPANDTIMHSMYEKNSMRKLLDYMKEESLNLSRIISNTDADNTMKRILNYIKKNYNKDLKLEMLAEIFNYNSSYLGKMFKNYTGESFNYYLDKVRIENAKLLLQNDLKVYQVSEKVGYKNIDYFYSKFKKYVGLSPKEFKKL